jgi:predicted TIM-barrel fold metal-dependent hydrolase
MKPVIDVHAHVFRGIDIPLKGYLLSRTYEWPLKLIAPLAVPVIARCVRRRVRAEAPGLVCRSVLELAYRVMGQGYRRWAEILSQQDLAAVARRLMDAFPGDGIELSVPLMIDYEYWFRNTRDIQIDDQVRKVASSIVVPSAGRIHPFVPFDPARELAWRQRLPRPDDPAIGPAEHVSSLALVKDAVLSRGFIGVKLYNSLGYRPLGNAEVDDARRRHFRRIGRPRYCRFSGEEIDAVLDELYAFCVANQVPIVAHCGSDGIEAYPGASLAFGSPEHWRPVLERHPGLHLDLAHFGWSHGLRYADARQRRRRSPNWIRTILGMLEEFPDLYTDVAHHEVVTGEAERNFTEDYRAMCADHPGLVQKRLLFGIDWHVIARMDGFEGFKAAYARILGGSEAFSPPQIEDFFGGNALRFLGLLPLGTSNADGWTMNRTRLAAFYAANHIVPPGWFTSTG